MSDDGFYHEVLKMSFPTEASDTFVMAQHEDIGEVSFLHSF